MGYLTRNKVYVKVPVSRDAKKIYILCEGEDTEVGYFKYFQGFSSNIDIIPIPNVNGESDPVKLKVRASDLFFEKDGVSPIYNLSKEYQDEVWFIIDTDDWNETGKIQQLRDFCDSMNQYNKCWFVSQSNPCFELWLYYHFHDNKPVHDNVLNSISFKDYVDKNIIGGFDNRKMPILIDKAIINSANNFELIDRQPALYSTELHNLAQKIVSFVRDQLNMAISMTI